MAVIQTRGSNRKLEIAPKLKCTPAVKQSLILESLDTNPHFIPKHIFVLFSYYVLRTKLYLVYFPSASVSTHCVTNPSMFQTIREKYT
jgi:hypothetical protein